MFPVLRVKLLDGLFVSCDLLQHTDPDYSAAYVVLDTNTSLKGCGLTFTVGRGTEIGELSQT